MRERFLPLRLSADLDAIVDGCRGAWNRLTAKTGRIASLIDHQHLRSARISESLHWNEIKADAWPGLACKYQTCGRAALAHPAKVRRSAETSP
jgi:hypothetical protein